MKTIKRVVVCHECLWWDLERMDHPAPYEPLTITQGKEVEHLPVLGACPKCGEPAVYEDGPANEETMERWEKEYQEEIGDWIWDAIRRNASQEMEEDPDNPGFVIGRCYLGNIFGLTPSGKVYTPFANSNITEYEAGMDEVWNEVLEKTAESHGMFIDYIDDGIFACVGREKSEDDEEGEEDNE